MPLYLAVEKNFHSHFIQFQVGSNGRYQYRLFGFIFFTTFMCGINYYTQGNLCYDRVIVARNIIFIFQIITFYQTCFSFYICRTASWLFDPSESKKSHLYRWRVWKIFLCRWTQWNQERCCCIWLHQLVSNTDIRCKIYELSSHMTTAMITSCSNCEKMWIS